MAQGQDEAGAGAAGARGGGRRGVVLAVVALLVVGGVSVVAFWRGSAPADPTPSTPVTSTVAAESPATPSPSPTPTPTPTPGYRFPTAVSANGRYLVDEYGDPYFWFSSALWYANSTMAATDWETALAAYEALGVNVIQVAASAYDPETKLELTYDGLEAWVGGDLTRPDERFWSRMDELVDAAAAHGVTVMWHLGGGYSQSVSIDQAREWGRWIGARYKDAPNIAWTVGADYEEHQWSAEDPHLLAVVEGLRASGDEHLVSVAFFHGMSSAANPAWRGVYDYSSAYTYDAPYDLFRRSWQSEQVPVVLYEANYEGENNTAGPPTTDETLRRTALWTVTSGGVGVAYGDTLVYRGAEGWRDSLANSGLVQTSRIVGVLRQLPWWTLEPDIDSTFLVGGHGDMPAQGTQHSGGVDPLESGVTTASIACDGTTALVFAPTDRPFAVDVGRLGLEVTVQRVDPASGAVTELPTQGEYGSAGTNSAGAYDWLYVFRANGVGTAGC